MSLVLSRRIGESILIGDSIVVRITGISGMQVRLEISAPADIKILREELLDRVEEESKHGN